jgi:hypothetical protein
VLHRSSAYCDTTKSESSIVNSLISFLYQTIIPNDKDHNITEILLKVALNTINLMEKKKIGPWKWITPSTASLSKRNIWKIAILSYTWLHFCIKSANINEVKLSQYNSKILLHMSFQSQRECRMPGISCSSAKSMVS